MRQICSIAFIAIALASCRAPAIRAQEIAMVPKTTEAPIADTSFLETQEHQKAVARKDTEIEILKNENRLLRVEVDALKKKLLQFVIEQKIDKVQSDLNQIVKE